MLVFRDPLAIMILEKLVEVRKLTVSEKWILAGELWDEVSRSPEAVPLSEAVMDELDRRLDAHEADPANVTSWAQIKAKTRGSAQ